MLKCSPYSHASEEALEQYAMGTLPESELANLKEHLPVCAECRERLFETALYVKAMRSAARRIIREEPTARG